MSLFVSDLVRAPFIVLSATPICNIPTWSYCRHGFENAGCTRLRDNAISRQMYRDLNELQQSVCVKVRIRSQALQNHVDSVHGDHPRSAEPPKTSSICQKRRLFRRNSYWKASYTTMAHLQRFQETCGIFFPVYGEVPRSQYCLHHCIADRKDGP